MNDLERRQWVENDEWLYNLQRASRLPLRAWVKENRETIDRVAGNVASGRERAHYLAYPGFK